MCRWKWSWDDLLSYESPKIAVIRDRRLGLLYYMFIGTIILYTIGYVILYQQRYLLLAPPVNVIRATLQSPQTKGMALPPPEELPYCANGTYANGLGTYNGFPCYTCQYWDENLVVYPTLEETAM